MHLCFPFPFHRDVNPGTHLLPPNLLKLFAPRPPLPYTRPLDRDIDRVRPKNVAGVTAILAQLKEDKTQVMISSGQGEGMEEGEQPLGEVELNVKFWRGLSGYHKSYSSQSKNKDMRKVIEADMGQKLGG